MAMSKLAPPWLTYVYELSELFKYDAEVHVIYDNDEQVVNLYVDDAKKAEALDRLLPDEKIYGNVHLKIFIIPSNTKGNKLGPTELSAANLYRIAFKGNVILSFVKEIAGIFPNNLIYIVFKKKVVQYFNDNLGDVYGNQTTLYQDIAKNVFGKPEGIYFCTDVEEPLGAGNHTPQWP